MKLSIYQVDAFTQQRFSGNPAAVVPLSEWLDDSVLQSIARENNLSETAFFVGQNGHYHLRWFTPACEVELCGHATLAAAYIIMQRLDDSLQRVSFITRSGELTVEKSGQSFKMNFPAEQLQACDVPDALLQAINYSPTEVLSGADYLLIFESEAQILEIQPDYRLLMDIPLRGVIVSAPGQEYDFVSRFFAPKCGIDEAPVTGSAHCALTPYWANKLNKPVLTAKQLSQRGGDLMCELGQGRVYLSGHCVAYLSGEIEI